MGPWSDLFPKNNLLNVAHPQCAKTNRNPTRSSASGHAWSMAFPFFYTLFAGKLDPLEVNNAKLRCEFGEIEISICKNSSVQLAIGSSMVRSWCKNILRDMEVGTKTCISLCFAWWHLVPEDVVSNNRCPLARRKIRGDQASPTPTVLWSGRKHENVRLSPTMKGAPAQNGLSTSDRIEQPKFGMFIPGHGFQSFGNIYLTQRRVRSACQG